MWDPAQSGAPRTLLQGNSERPRTGISCLHAGDSDIWTARCTRGTESRVVARVTVMPAL